ncbi:MAG: Ig-like domain-containing protein [Bacteroidales bacterium]|jgi:uncharacterized protein (TIGR02145 family)|nr:Ig-like domain-containing protein [Bacteroidales bacterium]
MKKIIVTVFAIALSFGVYAQNDTMYIHMGGTILEIPTKDVDSIIFYRTQTIPVESVSLNQTTATLAVGDVLQLTATVLPSNATYKTVTWSSSNTDVATVVDGLITAVGDGTANITVTTQDGGFSAICTLQVNSAHEGLNIPTCNNTSTPGWGTSFGTVSFASAQEWTIVGDGYTQIWSDAVRAANCNKSTYEGGPDNNYNSDCRNNGGGAARGHYFSWCAIARFKNTLCPGDWRVPTKQDFCDLHKALFSDTDCENRVITPHPVVTTAYTTTWGGQFVGNVQQNGQIMYSGANGYYWSEDIEVWQGDAIKYGSWLWFNNFGYSYSQYVNEKFRGTQLRCVKNN